MLIESLGSEPIALARRCGKCIEQSLRISFCMISHMEAFKQAVARVAKDSDDEMQYCREFIAALRNTPDAKRVPEVMCAVDSLCRVVIAHGAIVVDFSAPMPIPPAVAIKPFRLDAIAENSYSIPTPLPPGIALESFRLDVGEHDDPSDSVEEDWAAFVHLQKNVTLPSSQNGTTSDHDSNHHLQPVTRQSRLLIITVLRGFAGREYVALPSDQRISECRWHSSARKARQCARADLAGPLHRLCTE